MLPIQYSTVDKADHKLRVGEMGWEADNREVCTWGGGSPMGFEMLKIIVNEGKYPDLNLQYIFNPFRLI